MTDSTAAADTRYGTLVAPNLVAVNHDHYFNFRLDLDVDGPANTFNHDVYRPASVARRHAPAQHLRRRAQIAATEKSRALDTGHEPVKVPCRQREPDQCRRQRRVVRNHGANHARLMPDPEDWPAKRAGFLQHDFWATPFTPSERYAGGEYMFQSDGSDGLFTWSERDRPIRNQDIVVWVNIGMHHFTRAEDLPVMPTIWHSFRLRPHNFFNRNPAIDLRRETDLGVGPRR